MQAYRIVGWVKNYEVTQNGYKAAEENTPLEKLRANKIDYIRSKVYGHNLSPSFADLMRKAYRYGAGIDLAAFGLFHKLLELAANQKREYRGWILDHHQNPMDAAKLKRLLQVSDVDVITRCLELLCDPEIGWVELQDFTEIPKNIVNSQNNCGLCPQDSQKNYNACPQGSQKSCNALLIETETETEKKRIKETNRRKTSGQQKPQGSDSGNSLKDGSGSDSKTSAGLQKFLLELHEILPAKTGSDETTFKNIARHICKEIGFGRLTPDFYQQAIEAAKTAKDAKVNSPGKKIAMFVAWCKINAGFKATVKKLVSH